ncbi:DUF2512 family protein [Halobacillus sp. GSS1]|nr:DUF2512 family protein [Halobacillus sp. GSS1]MBN9655948.1 DUF2512 family protein [Halobacillus sp. GSS1]
MEHVKLFAMKFIFTFVVLFLILGGGFKISFGDVSLISFVLSLVGYAIGEYKVLDRAEVGINVRPSHPTLGGPGLLFLWTFACLLPVLNYLTIVTGQVATCKTLKLTLPTILLLIAPNPRDPITIL